MNRPGIARSINILLYHQVGDTPAAYTNLDCFCRTKEFYAQMEFLKNSNYKVIPLNKAVELLVNKQQIDDDYVVLTFDDGCERFYDITFPILEDFGFPSTIYPVANYLGKYAAWGKIKKPDLKILSENMLIELGELEVEIGAHTLDHVKLTKISREDAIVQVNQSKKILEDITGREISSFAYPHGEFNQETIDIVKEAGFTNALTCIASVAEEAESVYEVPRKYITCQDNLDSFKQKLR